MLRLTLAQMRRSVGRLVAAGVAIALGAAFVAATLLAGNAMVSTTYEAAASGYGDGDLVLTALTGELSAADLAAAGAVPGVVAVRPDTTTWNEALGSSGREWLGFTGAATDPRLEPADLLEGALPTAAGQVAVPADVAGRLGLDVGQQVTVARLDWADVGADGEPARAEVELTVSGLLDTPSAFLTTGGSAVLAPAQAQEWAVADGAVPYEATVLVEGSVGAARDALGAALEGRAQVLTRDQAAARQAAAFTGDTAVLTGIVLAFAAVALLVAALVIANTFQVLVAQRTRTLALLRCVGAQRGQIRATVLTEAALLGLVASVAGLALGTGLVQAALVVLGRTTDVPVPAGVTVTVASVLVPLAAGLGVTLAAALSPARAATKVSPLAALRPGDPVGARRSSRGRVVVTSLLVGGGGALLALGWLAARQLGVGPGLALGVLGGAVSVVGVLVGAVFWVPRLVAALGRLLGRGIAAQLASANAVRNPRRVATTSGALFIGVTLVAMMSTGAVTASRSFTAGLAERYPVDVMVSSVYQGGTPQPLPEDLLATVSALPGVQAWTVVSSAELGLGTSVGSIDTRLFADEPADLADVLLAPDATEHLDDTTLLLDAGTLAVVGARAGEVVTVTGERGSVELTVALGSAPMPLISTHTMAQLTAATDTDWWARLDPGGDPVATVTDVQAEAAASDTVMEVLGAAVERAFLQRVVDTLLAIVVGLLGVAVVIAVVGVANTLSLSVLERRRESATLRAIGLTRGQLRGALALEGLLVAVVGAGAGAVLGVAYGWVGTAIVLMEMNEVALVVPWRHLGVALAVAVLAGLLASVLPARTAARTPPVEALAAE